ncbi:Metallo-hydrolase/oxidoreductase, partial [Delitschia confertaspora ATCC 74209]
SETMASYLVTPKPPLYINIPQSSSTAKVRVIDTVTNLYLNSELFWQPKLPGFDGLFVPIYSFLISSGERHVIFDLGVRRDWENYSPRVAALIKNTTNVERGRNVADILDSDNCGVGITSKDIEAVIWSHGHFDHIGDPSTFPPSTDLVVGPGTSKKYFPGYPTNPDALVRDSDVEGRNVREIEFKEDGPMIGRFPAMDYFGDGSFYLLDAPGHDTGHLCGFVRVTSSPDSFIFIGADACHHPGVLRPTEYLPLPSAISPSPIQRLSPGSCPGSLIQEIHPKKCADKPFFEVGNTIIVSDHDAALETVKKIEELDAAENIFIILTHDASLRDEIDLYPKTINDWKVKKYRSNTRWLFLKDFKDCFEGDCQ